PIGVKAITMHNAPIMPAIAILRVFILNYLRFSSHKGYLSWCELYNRISAYAIKSIKKTRSYHSIPIIM
ncbi:MAG TPA: hypothetical protein PLT91_05410, partial [Clostridia bacterium]|nr:hypothetical protein [Clostridia bacterium]